ncbi:hypothetical protein AAMO2058_000859100 [Amorphochlora amoebiformis]
MSSDPRKPRLKTDAHISALRGLSVNFTAIISSGTDRLIQYYNITTLLPSPAPSNRFISWPFGKLSSVKELR